VPAPLVPVPSPYPMSLASPYPTAAAGSDPSVTPQAAAAGSAAVVGYAGSGRVVLPHPQRRGTPFASRVGGNITVAFTEVARLRGVARLWSVAVRLRLRRLLYVPCAALCGVDDRVNARDVT
jgi:hypothetical protein